MTFVTHLRLTSGDRDALDREVADIKRTAERKGVELNGPHARPTADLSVPLYQGSPPEGPTTFGSWRYTVYSREMEVVGHDHFARDIADREFPDSIHVEVEVDRRAGMG